MKSSTSTRCQLVSLLSLLGNKDLEANPPHHKACLGLQLGTGVQKLWLEQSRGPVSGNNPRLCPAYLLQFLSLFNFRHVQFGQQIAWSLQLLPATSRLGRRSPYPACTVPSQCTLPAATVEPPCFIKVKSSITADHTEAPGQQNWAPITPAPLLLP